MRKITAAVTLWNRWTMRVDIRLDGRSDMFIEKRAGQQATVNWSALGSVDSRVAMSFAIALTKAAAIANALNADPSAIAELGQVVELDADSRTEME